jgi:hypothetical protein
MRILNIGALACVAVAAACSTSNTVTPPAADAAIPEIDAAVLEDAGILHDAAAVKDAVAAATTFTQVYNDIISPICVACHNPNGIGVSMGHLDMSTRAAAFADLVNVEAAGIACGGMGTRVIPGNANGSIMFEKIDPGTPPPCGSKMPLGLPELSAAQAGEIQSWINGGALND